LKPDIERASVDLPHSSKVRHAAFRSAGFRSSSGTRFALS
jgi:hypothetical protein